MTEDQDHSVDTPDKPPTANVEFLSFTDICEIHDRALSDFGEGIAGFIDEHTVRSAAAQPAAGISGQYFYEFPAGMAAAYLYFLTNQEGFVNGNKRTAVSSAFEFLARNGYRLIVTPFEVYEVTVRIAGEDVRMDRKQALSELTEWIEERLLPVE